MPFGGTSKSVDAFVNLCVKMLMTHSRIRLFTDSDLLTILCC